MSEALRNSTGSIGTISNITGYREEIEKLIGGVQRPTLISTMRLSKTPRLLRSKNT